MSDSERAGGAAERAAACYREPQRRASQASDCVRFCKRRFYIWNSQVFGGRGLLLTLLHPSFDDRSSPCQTSKTKLC